MADVYKPDGSMNGYLAQPCFCRIVGGQFGARVCPAAPNHAVYFIPFDELARLYAIWADGFRLGRYTEATKDAEGT